MQYHDGRKAEAASPWTRLLRNDDRLTWTIAEAANLLGISRTSAYRARQRQRQDDWQQRTDRQEWRSDWRQQRQQRAGTVGDDAGQRQRWRQEQREQRQPPPGGANGQRPGATSSGARPKVRCDQCDGLRARHTVHHDHKAVHQRAQRRYDALLRKAAATTSPHGPMPAAARPRPCATSTACSATDRHAPARPPVGPGACRTDRHARLARAEHERIVTPADQC
jgi:hypothetical protein